MKAILIAAVAIAFAAASPAIAAKSSAQSGMATCAASWKAKSDTDKKSTTYKAYMSSCMKGGGTTSAAMATPAAAMAPASSHGSMASCATSWKGKSDTDKKATTYKAFMSSCMKGTSTASAAPAPAPMAAAASKPMTSAMTQKRVATSASTSKIAVEGNTGTSARCKDGQIITIKTHAGACSHHGGVAAWR
jgi:hypothetical protein